MFTSKQNKKIKLCISKLLLVATLATPLVFLSTNVGNAATESELKAKQQRLQELNNKIKEEQKQITNLVKQSNTLQNQISLYTAEINQATSQIVATETKIEIANDELSDLGVDIDNKEVQIDRNKLQLGEMLREMHELDRNGGALLALMNNDNLSDFLSAVDQIKTVQGGTYELLQSIKQTKIDLEEKKTIVEQRKNDLVNLRADLSDQKKALDNQVAAKNTLLTKTRGEEKNYRQLLAQDQSEQDKIEREIQDIEASIRKQLGQRATPGKKGIFVWPVNGVLTQGYGITGVNLQGAGVPHNGIDVAGPVGTAMYAAYDGVVNGVGSGTQAYGNWITIKHTLANGRSIVTLYGHMMRTSVSVGQTVKQGQVIGVQGNTGFTTAIKFGPHRGHHVHFCVFDLEGFRIVKSSSGNYYLPTGYTYNPLDFL